MRTTLLDDYIASCSTYKDKLHVCRHMDEVLKGTRPVPQLHRARGMSARASGLPDKPIRWDDDAMCVFTPDGIGPRHIMCVDVGQTMDSCVAWVTQARWSLEGLLLFQLDDTFDVVPLVRSDKPYIVIAEVQLHYTFGNGTWSWQYATTGPVNATFHEPMLHGCDEAQRQAFDENVNHLGNVISIYLGDYWDYLSNPGAWMIHPPRTPRVKVRDGKIKKLYKPGSVGYKEYTLDEE